MSRYISVRCDIQVDLSDIDEDDLFEELERRNEKRARQTMNVTDFEALIFRQRMVADLARQATVGTFTVTPAVREYFARVYGIDL